MGAIKYPLVKGLYCPKDIDKLYPWDKLAPMELKIWLDKEYGRGAALARAIGVPQSFVSNMASGEKPVPFEQCMPIETYTGGEVTRADLRPLDYLKHWPELAAAKAEPAQAATDLIVALVKTAITETKDAVLHAAEDELHQVKTDVAVELKHTAVEVRTDLEDAQRTAITSKWDGKERRTQNWDGQERREGVDRRNPEVLESPALLAVPGLRAALRAVPLAGNGRALRLFQVRAHLHRRVLQLHRHIGLDLMQLIFSRMQHRVFGFGDGCFDQRHYQISSCLRRFCLGCSQFRPDFLPVIGPQVLPRHSAFGGALNRGTALQWNRFFPSNPIRYGRRLHAQGVCQQKTASALLTCPSL
jgi:DNA-binding transcriptional regulator YdaS (Cro superfamily)